MVQLCLSEVHAPGRKHLYGRELFTLNVLVVTVFCSRGLFKLGKTQTWVVVRFGPGLVLEYL